MSWERVGSLKGPKGDTPSLEDVFLTAHPVGSLYWAAADAPSPEEAYGGTWVERPSLLGGRLWERTA